MDVHRNHDLTVVLLSKCVF